MDDQTATLNKLEQLNSIGIALSSESDLAHLHERILHAAMDLTSADAGTIYLATAEHVLEFRILINRTLNMSLGGSAGGAIDLPNIPIFDADGRANDHMVAAYAAAHQTTVNIADAAAAEGFDFSGTREFNRLTGYLSQSFLTVPLIDHERNTIGVLQLINAMNGGRTSVRPFNVEEQRLAESLASQAAVAYTNRLLINQLAELFESLVGMISKAIDEKSPYTSKHCDRVPILTMMIAERAHATTLGPLAGFSMSEADRYELKIAGMMHDCGKVTTPEHVMDKATKLESLHDRIHLVDARFELLRRDAAIARLEGLLAAQQAGRPDKGEALERGYRQRLRQLDADQAFLQHCNIGGEAMAAEDQARVGRIAETPWLDREGVRRSLLTPDEAACLSIPYGTLTASEREVINHHIVSTLNMLEALPWPKHLQNVPAYAGGHHERMDGKGYPRGLTGEQMPLQTRMMAIADIFEALTAADRPYKHPKPLSEALAIMGRMKLANHIDPDLFDLFVREKIYLDYARQYLLPEQIDAVDEQAIPGYQP